MSNDIPASCIHTVGSSLTVPSVSDTTCCTRTGLQCVSKKARTLKQPPGPAVHRRPASVASFSHDITKRPDIRDSEAESAKAGPTRHGAAPGKPFLRWPSNFLAARCEGGSFSCYWKKVSGKLERPPRAILCSTWLAADTFRTTRRAELTWNNGDSSVRCCIYTAEIELLIYFLGKYKTGLRFV